MLERFEKRFRAVEALASQAGRDLQSLSKQDWEEYWSKAKEQQE
jgi:uncharacterized protein YabN with tetrapyrrole methylase and pyrophosphatase domain